jgi:hypothetical protein
MLRNAIIHVANEQPFMADLLEEPGPNDVTLVCRNIRTMNGKKPVFVDFADSTFVMPIGHVRFIEIPAKAYEDEAHQAGGADDVTEPVPLGPHSRSKKAKEGDDADAAVAAAPPADGDELDVELLRRIHEA